MAESTGTFQSSWTLAESLIFDIANHLKTARGAWLTGQLEKYFWELEVIVRIIYGIIDDDEREESRLKEEKILKHIPVVNKENKIIIIPLLKDYDGTIMKFIHTHKLDVPPKRDRTVMIA